MRCGTDSTGNPALYVDTILADDDGETDVELLIAAHDLIWQTAMDHRQKEDEWVYARYVDVGQ